MELIKQRMTIDEAENAALELTVTSALYLSKEELEHAIDLLESIQDLDLERLNKVLDEGTKDADL